MDRRQGAPPSYAFVTRMYQRNLRPAVILEAFLAGLWCLFAGVGFFRNASLDRGDGATKNAPFANILGAMYLGAMGIEIFGIFAAATQRIVLVRIYAYLTVVVTLIIMAVGLMRTVIHFTLKNDIISACADLTNGDEVIFYGFWGPVNEGTLTPEEATAWCQNTWSHDSWSEVLSFLITSVLAAIFTAVAFSYLRQLLDPAHPSNSSRAPSNAVRRGGFPAHYAPAYNTPYTGQPQYAPPPGPPPDDDTFVPPYESKDSKLPGYTSKEGYEGYHMSDDKDPFADHHEHQDEGPSNERDVTSRPRPGEYDSFR